jgi:hypothetical protein
VKVDDEHLPYLQGKGKHKHVCHHLLYTYHVDISARFLKMHKYSTFQSENKKHAIGIANMKSHMESQTFLQKKKTPKYNEINQ